MNSTPSPRKHRRRWLAGVAFLCASVLVAALVAAPVYAVQCDNCVLVWGEEPAFVWTHQAPGEEAHVVWRDAETRRVFSLPCSCVCDGRLSTTVDRVAGALE